jgi:hypothetical protein
MSSWPVGLYKKTGDKFYNRLSEFSQYVTGYKVVETTKKLFDIYLPFCSCSTSVLQLNSNSTQVAQNPQKN